MSPMENTHRAILQENIREAEWQLSRGEPGEHIDILWSARRVRDKNLRELFALDNPEAIQDPDTGKFEDEWEMLFILSTGGSK